jgi:hypothetical protein
MRRRIILGTVSVGVLGAIALAVAGCDSHPPKPYGIEVGLTVPGNKTTIWAVGPGVNLSGHREVDPILQADLLYGQLQQVKGMTVVPVDRVVQAYAFLNIERVESPEQAQQVCRLLDADALVVPTVTAYDPYLPPKMGASLSLFVQEKQGAELHQSVGMFDSGVGSVRRDILAFANGRSDPNGPMAEREYFLSMDRYSGFVYHELIADLLGVPREPAPPHEENEVETEFNRAFDR